MDDDIAIKVEDISKTFKLPHEKVTSLKNIFTHLSSYLRKHRTFERQEALKNINFEIKKGEFFGIVGRNGSGKSTLLKLLAGIYKQDKGTISINGRLTPFIELGVGFNMELTGQDNVYLNGALLGFSRKEMEAMYQDIVDFAELERFMDQKLRNYSSGMQVRLAFSIAIRAHGDILLLDEVLAVGDAAFQQKCYDYFEELKDDKKTVVFVSHDMSAVRRFCNSAVYIKDGKLVQEGSAVDIAATYIEDNIESAEQAKPNKEDDSEAEACQISAKITKQTSDEVLLDITYDSKEDEEIFIGISLLKDGMSIAEINTLRQLKLGKKGKISYSLDTTIFNAGTYQMAAGAFTKDKRRLVGASRNRPWFTIKDNDYLVKNGPLKLADKWEQESAHE